MIEHSIIMTAEEVRAILAGRKSQTRRVVKAPRRFGGGDPSGYPRAVVGYASPAPEEYAPTVFGASFRNDRGADWLIRCPYGSPGDRLAVREAWRFWGWTEDGIPWVEYRADGEKRLLDHVTIPAEWGDRLADIWADLSTADNCPADDNGDGFRACDKGWRSPIHMPRWASRITLELTGVRVERVQEISDLDAVSEGASRREWGPSASGWSMDWDRVGQLSRYAGGVHSRGHEQPLNERDICLGSARMAFANAWNKINANRGYGWDANPWAWALSFKRIEEPK